MTRRKESRPDAKWSWRPSIFVPRQYSITRTRRRVNSGYTLGARTRRSAEKNRLKRAMFSASSRKSISCRTRTENSRTTAVRARTWWFGKRMLSQKSSRKEMSRSSATASSTPGRRTFTTTCSPPTRARWTCPRLAAATGSSTNSSKRSEIGRPSSASTTRRTASTGSGGTRSCSLPTSDRYGSGRMSARALRSCASLMNVGPRPARRARSRSALRS